MNGSSKIIKLSNSSLRAMRRGGSRAHRASAIATIVDVRFRMNVTASVTDRVSTLFNAATKSTSVLPGTPAFWSVSISGGKTKGA